MKSRSESEEKPRSDSEVEAIVEGCSNGSWRGWRYLLSVAKRRASRTLSPSDAEDVAQECAMALYKSLKAGQEVKNPAGLISFIAKGKIRDHYRKKNPLNQRPIKSRDPDGADELDSIADPGKNPSDIVVGKDLDVLRESLKEMKPPCSVLLKERYYMDKSYKEVAESAGFSDKQIGTRIQRCLKALRVFIKERSPLFFQELSIIFPDANRD